MTRNRLLALALLAALLAGCAAGKSNAPKTESGAGAQQAPSLPSPTAQSSPPPRGDGMSQPSAKPVPPDMQYQEYGVNGVVSTERQPVSTFGVDVDTASYTLTRSYLERGTLPPQEAVRAEEFINYFPQRYPAPTEDAIALHLDAAPNPFRPSYHLVQVGLKAKEVSRMERKPAVLTFVVDVSGSMDMENRLGLVKRSLNLLLDQLDSGDRVGIVIYGSRGEVVLEHTNDQARIRAAIDRLKPSGSTNAEEGLMLGYDLASRGYREGSTNRVILCSDGVANVGRTGPEAILQRIADFRTKGITLTTVGFGMGNYNDVLMEQLADKGDGTYAYVDTQDEARRVFVEQLTGTLELVAKDVKIQVRFDPEQVVSYRLVGYENRALKNEDFRNDKADAGEMGAGHSVTALYEVQLRRGASRDLGSVSVRYQDASTGAVHEQRETIEREQVAASASARLRWTASVAEFAGILKGSPWAVETPVADVMAQARRAADDLDGSDAHREFLGLVQQAMRLRGDR